MKTPERGHRQWLPRSGAAAAVMVTLLIVGFYHWIYITNYSPSLTFPYYHLQGVGLYNMSVDGYLAGKLHFLVKPSPELLALPDPYDASLNAAYCIREASLYHGEYYLYFGPVPALTFYLPIKLLTGFSIADTVAMNAFGTGCFLVSVLILLHYRSILQSRGYFSLILCLTALGLNNFLGHFLRRPAVFEVAIIAAEFWLLAATYFFTAYFAQNAKRAAPLAVGSFCLGLAIGCRYGYALCTPVLFLPVIFTLKDAGWRTREFRLLLAKRCVAAFAPWGAVVALLFTHNYLRFGNPLEFGQKYQLTAVTISKLKLTSLTYVLHNFVFYFLSFIKPDILFPFWHGFSNQPLFAIATPPGYHTVWSCVGVLNCPFFLLILIAVTVFLYRSAKHRPEISYAGAGAFASVLLPALANIFVLLVFCGIVVRYLLDFVPLLLLAACFSYLWLEKIALPRPRILLAIRSGRALLVFYGVAVNLALSMEGEYQSVKRVTNPALFARMEARFEAIPRFFFREGDYGSIRLRLRFPPDPVPRADPLVSTGTGWLADMVCVWYPSKNTVQFGYFHDLGETHGIKGHAMPFAPDREHIVEISMGSLYPRPLPFLLALGYDPNRESTLQIKLDGKTALEGKYVFYDSLPSEVSIGRNEFFPNPIYFNPAMFNGYFSGTISDRARLPFLPKTGSSLPGR